MSRTALNDASDVLFKPLLDFALGLSEVEYIQLIKLVPQKISNPFSLEFNGKKIGKHQNEHNVAMLNFLTRDRLGTS